jgi:Ca2+:H+ antiporter
MSVTADSSSREAAPGMEKQRNNHHVSNDSLAREELPVHEGQLTTTVDGAGGAGSGLGSWVKALRVRPAGESGRHGVHPWQFLRISFRSSSKVSSVVNVLWPAVPAALAVRYALPEHHLLVFVLSYVAMVPCANLIGFAGQELARKVPHVFGVLTETTLGSIVEIILFMVLLVRPSDEVQVIQAAILGSILATMLLCLGLCFFVGGLRRDEQEFDEAVSEAGNGLLLTA